MLEISKNFISKRQFYMFIALVPLVVLAPQTPGQPIVNEAPESNATVDSLVIYGEDSRREIRDSNNKKMVKLARSTAILIDRETIADQNWKNSNFTQLPKETFGESYGLCEGERFEEQANPGFCSGFLIDDKTLVTAGHCIPSETICDRVAVVFDFAISSVKRDPTLVHNDNVYYFESVIATIEYDISDLAIIKLNRKVSGDRKPLQVRRSGVISKNTPLTVIGHPSGLPTKIADDASVRSADEEGFFVANLDTFGGNSGSAVFNGKTGLVEGVLVRGEQDFLVRDECYISNVCGNSDCRGEDVTRVSEFAQYLPGTSSSSKIKKWSGKTMTDTIQVGERRIQGAIPDYDPVGFTKDFTIEADRIIRNVTIYFNITHPYTGDLRLSLTHPDGSIIVLRNRSGGSKDDIDIRYGYNDVVAPALNSLREKGTAGVWSINVADLSGSDIGVVNTLSLTIETR